MISEFMAWAFTLFVVGPLQAEVSDRLTAANMRMEAVQQSQQCIAAQAPRLIERASGDMWWATSTAVGITTGWTDPATLLDLGDPRCAPLAGLLNQKHDGEA